MTAEELAASSIPLIAERLPPIAEESAAQVVVEFESCEEGEVDFGDDSDDGEDLLNVEANLDELMPPKSLSSNLIFGKSQVTPALIKEYEEASFFPSSNGRAPTAEEIPTLEPDEIVVFRDFCTAGLQFPCDDMLPSILNRFSMKMHHLTPNSFLKLSKFFWIMRTFECQISANIFARLSELHI
jgi:hypothetical protein